MKTKLITITLLMVMFIQAFAQDICECNNLKINVTTENLFNEVRIVKTRNQLDSFILNPLVFNVNLQFIGKFYTKTWNFTNYTNTGNLWVNKDTLLTKITEDNCVNFSSFKHTVIGLKNIKSDSLLNFALISNKHKNDFFTLLASDNHAIFGSEWEHINFGIDSIIREFNFQYKYERGNLNKLITNDSLVLYYYLVPDSFLQKLGVKRCLVKSNTFIIPPSSIDTNVFIDRLDTFIDRGFYSNYPYQNSLMEDVCYKFQTKKPGLYPYLGFIVYKNYAEQLYKKYGIKTKLKHEFIKEYDNRIAKYAIIKSKKFKLTAKYVFGDTLMIRRIEYYPSGNEYLFKGIYHNDDCRFFESRFYAWNSKEFLSKLIYINESENDCKSFERGEFNYGSDWKIKLEFKKRSNKIKKIVLIKN